MLALPNHLVVFHVHGNSFREGPFHNVFRDWLEADWSVVSQIFSLGDGYIFALFQSFRTCPDLYDLSKMK